MNIWHNYTKINNHASSQQEQYKKKRFNKKQPLAWSTLLLERIFQGSKKFMQLSLKPKNPSLREYQNGDQKYEKSEWEKVSPLESIKESAEF